MSQRTDIPMIDRADARVLGLLLLLSRLWACLSARPLRGEQRQEML